ncbi:MAG: radical SAM protein [Anaerolineales bacterium]|nr:radical SAM protein [Anaerolineales bacterium]MCB9126630.1 radical SAM protein [Ardenticatenales bacterium]MCB9172744.1 radical SAM protein [Ardenticatenales bacterium]
MLELLPKLPLYWSFYKFGTPKMLPFSIVVSVSFRCNSKCKTCDVWRRPNDDMSAEEWRKVFHKLGRTPFYITFTGGEPFLRKDLDELVIAAYEECRPEVVTIPTNGILTERILEKTDRMCRAAQGTNIGINLSLDEVGERHDRLRVVPGNWEKAMETWRGLKALQKTHSNLVLTVHSVISQFNIERFYDIYHGLAPLAPDSYITEVAEERAELATLGWEITPLAEQYAPIADFLSAQARSQPVDGLARVTQAFRAQYYQLAKKVLFSHEQEIPCHAGWASGHIAPNGDVWTCCIRAESVGNLRETDYDLRPIWFEHTGKLRELRRSIAAGECACPMANANYANMLLHPPTLAKVGTQVGRGLILPERIAVHRERV